jgi:hypothetical protein
MDKLFNIFGTLVILAIVTTVVTHGKGAATVISAALNGFGGDLKAGQGL